MGRPIEDLAVRRAANGTSGPGRPRSQAADQAILRGALEVFLERGIDGATIERIADHAGVARTTLYRRWSSKEELIAQAVAAARGAPEQDAVSNRVALVQWPGLLVDALAEMLTRPDYQKMAARLIGSLASCPELMAIYWHNYMAPRREIIRKLLERACAEGLIRQDSNPELLMDLISGAIIHHALLRPGRRSGAEMRAYLIAVLRELGLSGTVKPRPRKSRRA
jgi:AcrR family transcriptional regulator